MATAKNNEAKIKFTLSDGTKAEMRQGKGIDAIKARKNAGNIEAVEIYLAAELTTFNGEKKPAEELMQLPLDDFLLIETKAKELIATKNFQKQVM